MGSLVAWTLEELNSGGRECFKNYVETGLGEGISLLHALKWRGIKNLYSVELDARLFESITLRERLNNVRGVDQVVGLINDNSTSGLVKILPKLDNKPTLFFLDAHFPESDFFGLAYESSVTKFPRNALPLLAELALISSFRKANIDDLIIVDDLILFEEGNFGFDLTHPLQAKAIRSTLKKHNLFLKDGLEPVLRQIFGHNVVLKRDNRDQGYLLIRPS